MATNPYVNKVVYDGTTIIDISDTTATASDVLNSKYIYTASGQKVQGSIASKSSSDLTVNGATVTAPAGFYSSSASKTIPDATWGTASESVDIDTDDGYYIYSRTYPNFVNGYINSSDAYFDYYMDLEDKSVTPSTSQQVITPTDNSCYLHSVTVSAMPSGTEGTPTATKGTVSNHSVSVTPSVTNSAGYISGGTHNGTAVTVSASELASGNKEITQNGSNIDVVGFSTVSVNVSGGGGSSVSVGTKTATLSSASSSISFTGLNGEPTSFAVTSSTDQSTGGTKVVSVVYDGTSCHGMDITTQAADDTGFTQSYSNGTLTITATTAQFQANEYKLVYSYGGGASNIGTADVQVGSGATSITFTGLEDEPVYWSCIFKSTFSTSSGYQRVMEVVYDGTSVYGHALDSSAKALTSWSQSYNNGSLTITSTGTNNGGYFHQPGYYQLTYVIGEASPYEKVSKTYRASTTAQSEKIEPSTGYDAMSEVNISIPAVTQTNLTAANIKSGTTVTISNGSTNLWSVTGTYSGGGSASIATATMTNSSNQNTSIAFTLPSGRTPKAFFARLTSQIARNSNSRYYYVFDMRWDGSSTGGVAGNTFYMYNGTLTNVTSGYSYSQSGTTFTLSSTGSRSASPGSFYNGDYELVYVY